MIVLTEFILILSSTVAVFITALSYMILARVLLQFFGTDESKMYQFCYAVTEPVVSPVRDALSHFEYLEDIPVDFSYLATFMLLTFVRLILPPVTNFL